MSPTRDVEDNTSSLPVINCKQEGSSTQGQRLNRITETTQFLSLCTKAYVCTEQPYGVIRKFRKSRRESNFETKEIPAESDPDFLVTTYGLGATS